MNQFNQFHFDHLDIELATPNMAFAAWRPFKESLYKDFYHVLILMDALISDRVMDFVAQNNHFNYLYVPEIMNMY
ncbi:hypothetical protein OUZ56_028130 [Daphnia magna]|uniref:Uncharacterized protein n=1 Tax=Daphnia magna TaxID=35525 RepID=A0ABR0B349_9CRUS|nr:hypothetical protein OUZ56_028130 [Daphnia magna]